MTRKDPIHFTAEQFWLDSGTLWLVDWAKPAENQLLISRFTPDKAIRTFDCTIAAADSLPLD